MNGIGFLKVKFRMREERIIFDNYIFLVQKGKEIIQLVSEKLFSTSLTINYLHDKELP